ncbi:isochorismatase family protein [Planosporangium mesophilum]|uniref:N-carbamoylsarcosine amidase n=1 Tax=Planosporangium mesophilum TaxID=689768 RepID=A0A8J3TDG1_9ACTN|nr:isochorismatase family protein [Planosporangium mesophilum]GII23426.1 N-carbamoylsarcosine amidase [Planosporangium mesophilum]
MVDPETLATYDRAGFGAPVRRGVRPAVLVVDFSYGFTDPAYPTGADMSAQIDATRQLLDAARDKDVPVVFTTIAYDKGQLASVEWLKKARGMAALEAGSRLVEIDTRLSPREDEAIVVKTGASAFFGTPLASMLAGLRIDTLIVTGATTSGCVRASVVDAVQSGYPTLVPRQCVADRAQAPHDANLFDMNAKYADVIDLDEALAYVRGLPTSTPSDAEVPA